MDFDKLVKEWFYRLPKGYADAPYSQEELAVLDEVMTEQGVSLPEAELEKEKFTEPDQMRNEVDQLDQAFNDAEPVDDLDEEILTEAEIDDIQATETLEKIFSKNADLETAITNNSGSLEKVISFLKSLPGGQSLPDVEKMLTGLSKTESSAFIDGIANSSGSFILALRVFGNLPIVIYLFNAIITICGILFRVYTRLYLLISVCCSL